MQCGRLFLHEQMHYTRVLEAGAISRNALKVHPANMQSTVACLALLIAVASAATIGHEEAGKAQNVRYIRGYTGYDSSGAFIDFFDYSPDLSLQGVDNTIYSSCLTGNWIIYDGANYGPMGGLSCSIVGITACEPNLGPCSGVTSSLRYAGSPNGLNTDYVNLYEGDYFTGAEFRTGDTVITVGDLDQAVSSIIISGTSDWTFFTGPSFSGASACVGPNEQLIHEDGTVLDFTRVAQVADVGLPDNAIRSVMKGCFADRVEVGSQSAPSPRTLGGAVGAHASN